MPGQMKYVKPINPVTTWHLLQDNPENAAFYVSSLNKSSKSEHFHEKYWFPTPEDPGGPQQHTPIQKRTLTEQQNLQELEKLNPQDDPESRRQFLTNFDWTDSMLQPEEIAKIENLLVEFHDIFAPHEFDIGMNEEFKVKLTSKMIPRPIVKIYQHLLCSRKIFVSNWHFYNDTG